VYGHFGDAFAAIAKTFGAQVDVLEFPWGTTVKPGRLKSVLRKIIGAVVVTHNESSTGVFANLAAIGAILEPSYIIGSRFRQRTRRFGDEEDEWGIDIVASASQSA